MSMRLSEISSWHRERFSLRNVNENGFSVLFSDFFSIIVVLLSILLPFVLSAWKVLWPRICDIRFKRQQAREYVRTITGSFRRMKPECRWGFPLNDRSGILLNAVLLNITSIIEDSVHLREEALWVNKPSVLFLFDPLKSDSFYVLGDDVFEYVRDTYENLTHRIAECRKRLQRYTVLRLPTAGTWMPLKNGIEVTYQRRRVDETEVFVVEHKIHLKTTGKDGPERIEQFVQYCLSNYMTGLPSMVGVRRRHFQLQSVDADSGVLRFKESLLPSTRTFDTLFFPQKNPTLTLIDNFVNKRGRFGIQGFPRKLGFLVHGPSGTGKTSFVAALAAYTNRHIISVHLPYIATNNHLYSIFLDRRLRCYGQSDFFQFDFDDVIFLLDDVDPTEEIIQRRVAPLDMINNPSATVSIEANQHGLANSLLPKYKPPGAMNLSGLLNVLDGIVDTPGRIIAMTTRQPDSIDPALLRPGRFGHRLQMEYMRLRELLELLGLHFGEEKAQVAANQLVKRSDVEDGMDEEPLRTMLRCRELSEEAVDQVRRFVFSLLPNAEDEFSICPAVAESMCLTSITLNEFLEQLRRHFSKESKLD